MEQPTQQVDAFTATIIEQRNAAQNEAAYWRAKAIEAQAELAKVKAEAKEE